MGLKKYVVGLVAAFSSCLLAQPDTAWYCSYGGPGVDYGADVKELPGEGLIVAGNTASFGQGAMSAYLVKTDFRGKKIWTKTVGTAGNDLVGGIELASDGGFYIAGSTDIDHLKGYDAYLTKTDKFGNEEWTRRYGGSDWDFVYGSCKLPNGNLVLCGESFAGNAGTRAYLLLLTNTGDTLWTRRAGINGENVFNGVTFKNGRIYAAGHFYDALSKKSRATVCKYDLSGNLVSSNSFYPNAGRNFSYKDVCISTNGELVLCGKMSGGLADSCFLLKTDTVQYTPQQFISHGYSTGFNAVREGSGGNFFVAGRTTTLNSNTSNVLLFEYSPSFGQSGFYYFGGVKDEDVSRLAALQNGGCAFVGSTASYGNSSNAGLNNLFLVVTNKNSVKSSYYEAVSENADDLSPLNTHTNNGGERELMCYPNPVSGDLHLQSGVWHLHAAVGYTIYNANGHVQLSGLIYPAENKVCTISTHPLPPGIYLICCQLPEGAVWRKTVVKF